MAKGLMTPIRTGSTGAMGPHAGTMRKRPVTTGEVRRARAQAVGGRRKRCRRGKNCSAACIQSGMVCLVEFPEPVQQPLRSVRDYLMKKNNVQPGSIQDKRINAALTKLAEVAKVEGPAASSGKPNVVVKGDEKRANRTGVTYKEVQDLKKRKDLLGEAEVKQEALKSLHKDAMSRGLRLPRQELEMIYDVLPKNLQTSLAMSGRAGQDQWFAGVDANGQPIFSKRAGKERALAVLDMWFRQGGTDGYQSRGGKVWAPKDLSVEHIIPLSKGGKDVPSNWILVRRGTNLARQSKDLGKWIDSLPNNKTEYKGYLGSRLTEKRRAQAKKARLAVVNPKDMSDGEVFAKGAKSLTEIFRGENGGKSPSIFSKEWLPVKEGATRTGNAGPPAPFYKALALIGKTDGLDAARSASIGLRKTWNTDWKTNGSLTKQQAYQEMLSQMKGKLTAEQYNEHFYPAAQAWARKEGFL